MVKRIIRQYSIFQGALTALRRSWAVLERSPLLFQFHVSQQSNVSYGHKTESSLLFHSLLSTKEWLNWWIGWCSERGRRHAACFPSSPTALWPTIHPLEASFCEVSLKFSSAIPSRMSFWTLEWQHSYFGCFALFFCVDHVYWLCHVISLIHL